MSWAFMQATLKPYVCDGGELGRLEVTARGPDSAATQYRERHKSEGKRVVEASVRRKSGGRSLTFRFPEVEG